MSSVQSVAINLANSLTPADPSQLIQLTHTYTHSNSAGCIGTPPCSLLLLLTLVLKNLPNLPLTVEACDSGEEVVEVLVDFCVTNVKITTGHQDKEFTK